jgi:ABC-type sugar transport system ATPase subunit
MNQEVILRTKNITKSFGGLVALKNISFELNKGDVLALVGDNGAGKSTLIKILSGAQIPDSGEIFINEKKVQFNSPTSAHKMGIETVYQNLALINTQDIANNLFLGKEKTFSPFGKNSRFFRILKHREMEKSAKEILDKLDIYIPKMKEQVKYLSGGQRQCIAVAKASTFGQNIVFLDEPTAALGVKETKHVLNMTLKLKEEGITIIIITHNLEHAFMVADRFLILRLGEKIGERLKSETNVDEIVKLITGGVFVDNNSASS